jgi:hypothetical protein
MSRPKKLVPDYCRDRSTDRAFVILNGRKKYLGAFGSQESRDAYARVIGEWNVSGRGPASARGVIDGLSVARLLAEFWTHAKTYYRDKDGNAGEALNYRDALRPVLRLYGRTAATEFGPLALRTVREGMVKLGGAGTTSTGRRSGSKACSAGASATS